MMTIFSNISSTVKSKKLKRLSNSLQWRQLYQKSDTYEYMLEDGRVFKFFQEQNGEVCGKGTGASIWPAAHVLCKYLEKKFGPNGMIGLTVCDIGSGSGCTGLIAAILGAITTLSDQECILHLTDKNMKKCAEEFNIPLSNVCVKKYNWGYSPQDLQPPFKIVLVSDCILPKLYPIEPLIQAVSAIIDENTICYFSYEHRVFPHFDPRQEFRRIAALYGMKVRLIPIEEHHPIYCSEEIELWEVVQGQTSEVEAAVTSGLVRGLDGDICVKLGSYDIKLNQQLTSGEHGRIGGDLWKSALVLSKLIMSHESSLESAVATAGLKRNPWAKENQIQNTSLGKVAVELGAGCGLVSMALCLQGYRVVATDKACVMDLLRQNINSFLQQISELGITTRGTIVTAELNWDNTDDEEMLTSELQSDLKDKNSLFEMPVDLVAMSDCLYATASIDPLLKVLCKISSRQTVLVLANEMRSALDSFMRKARHQEPNWDLQTFRIFSRDSDDSGGTTRLTQSGESQLVAIGCLE